MKTVLLRSSLVILGLLIILLGAWGAYGKARELLSPPTPLPYALDALTADQPDGASGLVPVDAAQLPNYAPTLERMTPEPTATVGAEPQPTQTPAPPLPPPSQIQIQTINLDAPVVEATEKTFLINDNTYKQWQVPDEFAAGWSKDSGRPGGGSNVVLFGHHTSNGAVFANLIRLKKGDLIQIVAGDTTHTYSVRQISKVKERGVSFAQMIENASWLLPSPEERLTLVTCWPPYESTYRLIVIALPERDTRPVEDDR